MQKRLLAIGVLTVFMIAALIVKSQIVDNLGRNAAYLFWLLVSACAGLILVLAIHYLFESRRVAPPPRATEAPLEGANRRRSFRVTYPATLQPVLIVERVNQQAKRQVELPVVDISEEGISLIDNGFLGKAKELVGILRFPSGETKPVACDILRQKDKRICARLQRPLSWEFLIKEQRKLLAFNNDRLPSRIQD